MVDTADLDRLAAEVMRDATVSPDQARIAAELVRRNSVAAKSWASASVASRALGVAHLQLRELTSSSDALQESMRYAKRAGSRELLAGARMSFSVVLCLTGHSARAVREIERALDDLEGPAAARALTQRAAVLQDLGRLDEALSDLRKALPQLRKAGDVEWETRLLSNRGILLITRRAFTAAEDDLLVARRLCAEHGLELQAAYVEHNLGWLYSSRREVVLALEHLNLAQVAFDKLGMQVGSILADRAELLLSVRMLAEARDSAESAVEIHQRQKRNLQVPEAQLLLSTVALVQGDTATAGENADLAIRGFRRLHKPDGLVLARYARLQARIAGQSASVTPGRARAVAAELAAAGWVVPALEARISAGLLALERGRRADARADLAAAARARFTGPAELRARAWFAEAQLRLADGRRRSAKSAVSAGIRVLENYQATMGATELRAHVSLHRGALARLGLQIAVQDHAPRQVLSFVERGRASALRAHAVRPPDDPTLSHDLADLRSTVAEIEEGRRDGRSTTDLTRRQVRLERAIAENWRRLPATSTERTTMVPIAELAAALGDTALVEFVELRGTTADQPSALQAVTLVDGRARLHDLGPLGPIADLLPHLLFGLHRLANPRASAVRATAAKALISRIGQTLDRTLFAPLGRVLGDRRVVLVPAGPLQSIPWSVIPFCAGRPVTVSPSATLWHRAAQSLPTEREAKVVVVAGPLLSGAREEAEAVGRVHPGGIRLTGAAATAQSVMDAMDGASLVHIAAHGKLRADNPLFSSLLMADGPLTVYDLQRLERVPRHVVLAACEAARHQRVADEVGVDEVLGLAAALLSQGTHSLVAPVISVPDIATVPTMLSYHAALRSGRTPAEALAVAQQDAAARGPDCWAAAAPFVCLGAGHRRIVARSSTRSDAEYADRAAEKSRDAVSESVLVSR